MLEHEQEDYNLTEKENVMPTGAAASYRYLRPKDTARLLIDFLWQEYELSRLAFGWLPAVADYELKTKLGRFGYLHSQHTKALHTRLIELPGSLNVKEGTPALTREVFERISQAPDTASFITGYLHVLRRMYVLYDGLAAKLDTILDAPTVDHLRTILYSRHELVDYLYDRLEQFGDEKPAAEQWQDYVAEVWSLYEDVLAHRLDVEALRLPVHPAAEAAGPVPAESSNDPQFPVYERTDAYKQSYSDPTMSPLQDSVRQMHYINATEISAAESLCYLYYGVQKMPLEFYYDLARHLWDEVRHSQMGVRRLKQMGYKTEQFKFFNTSPGASIEELKQEWFPDMYAGLTMVAEPCSFVKKRKCVEKFWEFGDALSAIQCEFDMVDERMHVEFGKTWGPELYKQIDDIITAREMSERARIRRLEKLEIPGDPEEIRRVAKNFPGFCGLSTVELQYTNY